MALELWLKRYGSITALITGVVIVTVFLNNVANELKTMRMSVQDLNAKVSLYVVDRQTYERWNKQENSRIKRIYNRLGWEYEPIE